jgi:hypothetical protein
LRQGAGEGSLFMTKQFAFDKSACSSDPFVDASAFIGTNPEALIPGCLSRAQFKNGGEKHTVLLESFLGDKIFPARH